MNIPHPPFKGGKSEAKGGMLSLQRGNAEAKHVEETGDPLGGGLLIQLLIVNCYAGYTPNHVFRK
ncbi:hypothetical protein CLI86_06115 [Tannerella forsythia]|uniref:Uncharacterized protein n=1 Tax=Tannerella forsythia TaxID=28112 RepID=A0A2A6E7L4_TANFO|nr:hypothetical protein CLI86_06115 [Tannerella forsythia]